jgi:P pilus assembly chaperone PapD
MKWFTFLLLPALACAQLQLFVAPPNSETAVAGVYDLGKTSVGDQLDTRFRIRNMGAAAVSLTSLRAAGSGFSLFGQPTLPHLVAPGSNVDFTVRFAPQSFGTYSANLSVNGTSLLLTGSAAAGAVLTNGSTTLISGATIDVGRAERGSSVSLKLQLKNPGTSPITVQSIAVTGAAFRLNDLALPMRLDAGASRDLEVTFTPVNAGVATGTLTLDDRKYTLTGAGSEPLLPRPSVVLDPVLISSGQQGRASVRFATASPGAGRGKLTLTFRPLNGTDNDAAIQFVSSASRTVDLAVTQGSALATIGTGTATEAVFQTGTTAGTIVFTVEMGGYTEQTSLAISPATVSVNTARGTRTAAGLELDLSGFDNSRTVSQLAFTFYDRSGSMLQPGAIRVDGTNDFRQFFAGSNLGGVFSLKASFPVTGDSSMIGSAEVELTNSTGVGKSQRVQF